MPDLWRAATAMDLDSLACVTSSWTSTANPGGWPRPTTQVLLLLAPDQSQHGAHDLPGNADAGLWPLGCQVPPRPATVPLGSPMRAAVGNDARGGAKGPATAPQGVQERRQRIGAAEENLGRAAPAAAGSGRGVGRPEGAVPGQSRLFGRGGCRSGSGIVGARPVPLPASRRRGRARLRLDGDAGGVAVRPRICVAGLGRVCRVPAPLWSPASQGDVDCGAHQRDSAPYNAAGTPVRRGGHDRCRRFHLAFFTCS